MRKSFLFWIVSFLAIGLSACTTLKAKNLDTAKACAEWRWIGISQPAARCPDIPGWTAQPLFPQLAPAQEICEQGTVPDAKLISELNRFCVYEIANPKKRLKHVPFPPAVSAGLVRFDRDCAALSPSGGADREPEARRLSEQFLAQAGRPRTLTINDRLGVRLAFLDTQPTGIGVPKKSGRSQHGYTLTHIARHLVCSPETSDRCAAQITTQLALPIVKFNAKKQAKTKRDEIHGGRFGMQSDLAKAIRDEVDAWQSELRRGSPQQHLVLNLSLAWDGELFGGLDAEQIDEMTAGTQAVYQALEYAASYDALVLAAAGNRKDCPLETVGPLLPAAWERGGPAEESCALRRQTSPLLYAVGGVQSQGEPIFNARRNGMPQRAAFAENAVVPSWDPEYSTAVYTGSSVATAVVSSIAAVVWDTRPERSAAGVMDLLDHSGDILPLKADFWFGSGGSPAASATGAPNVHRLSLCAALEKACEGLRICPAALPCERWAPQPPLVSRLAANPLPACTCQPWTFPQPEDPPCPNPNCPPEKLLR
jgi:subtilase family protein